MPTNAKQQILKRIKNALVNTVPMPFPNSEGNQTVYIQSTNELIVTFAEEFTKLQGKFVFCPTKIDFENDIKQLIHIQQWQHIYCIEEPYKTVMNNLGYTMHNDLPSCQVSITGCEFLVARTGTMVLSAAQQSGRTTSVYAPIHICVAYTSQLLQDVKNALQELQVKYGNKFPSFVTFASGPSRTADIEKTLVTGVHGPKEVYCFVIDDAF